MATKTAVTGTSMDVARRLADQILQRVGLEVQVKRTVRYIGVDNSSAVARRLPTANARQEAAGARMKRTLAIAQLQPQIAGKLAMTGFMPQHTYHAKNMGNG